MNQQRVVYHFPRDLCDAGYVGYKTRHLFQRVAEAHGGSDLKIESRFKILKKCQSKFDCLVFEYSSV